MSSRARACRWMVAVIITGAVGGAQAHSAVERIRADLAALTAPEMGGREAGTPGGHRAEGYLAERFAGLGLEPLGSLGYRQEFAIEDPRPVRIDPAGTGLVVRSGGVVRRLALGEDFVPFRFSAEGSATGRLVCVGYGLRVPELGWDDYAGVDVSDCIVLVLRGAPGWREPGSRFADRRAAIRFAAKITNARAAGARGLVLVDVDQDRGGDPPSRAVDALGEVDLPAAWISRRTAEYLLAPLDLDLVARSGEVPRAAELARSLQLDVAFAERRPPRRTSNVLGLLRGADPGLRDQVVVVAAHHDHIGLGSFGSLRPGAVGEVHPGADDNASGCAVLLEVARAMGERPRPRRTVVFAAFGAEELGLRGSRHLLESGLVPAAQVLAAVNLNMVGRATSDRLRVEGVGTGTGLAVLVGRATVRSQVAAQLREGASPRSDHAAFLARGVPALFVHSGLHEAYHTPDDLPDRIRLPECAGVARLVTEIVGELVDLDDRPEFRRIEAGFGERK